MRVFVRSLNWLGDAIFQAPALRLLKMRWPEAELVIQAKPAVSEVVRAYGLGELVPWHSGRMARAMAIHAQKPDLALLMPKSFGTALDAFVARVPQRAGWAGQGRSLLLTRRLPRWNDGDHYALRFRALVAALVGAGENPATSAALHLPEAWADAAASLTADLGRPYAVLAPGASGGLAKQWEPAHWQTLAKLLAEAGLPSYVVGKPEEAALGAFVAEGHPGVRNLVGRTDLKQLGGLAGRAALVLANDSGLLHLAAALGAPLVGIYGPTSPETSYPLGAKAWALWNRVECAPCFRRTCPIDHRCMQDLRPEAVLAVASALVEGREPASPFLAPRPSLPGIAHN